MTSHGVSNAQQHNNVGRAHMRACVPVRQRAAPSRVSRLTYSQEMILASIVRGMVLVSAVVSGRASASAVVTCCVATALPQPLHWSVATSITETLSSLCSGSANWMFLEKPSRDVRPG